AKAGVKAKAKSSSGKKAKIRQAEVDAAKDKIRLHRMKHSTIARVRDYKKKGHAYKLVFEGKKKRTSGKLFKRDLMRNKRGRVVSKKRHARGCKLYKENGLDKWMAAVQQTKEDLGLTGFVLMKKPENGGKGGEVKFYQQTLEKWFASKIQRMSQTLKGSGSQARLGLHPCASPASPPVPMSPPPMAPPA
ncbi:unnamed protein product, partial [Polarella glacialis]